MKDNLNLTPAALAAAARGDFANAITAMTPGRIEAQEAAGQRDMASMFRTLPKDMDREPGEAFGFVYGEDVDDIFVSVRAPAGWSIHPTDHSMHSDIIDEKGRTRGSIFYKAAFYDRNANGHWRTRYRIEGEYAPDYDVVAYKGVDTAVGETLFSVPIPTAGGDKWQRRSLAEQAAGERLAELYPDHKDVTAYWE